MVGSCVWATIALTRIILGKKLDHYNNIESLFYLYIYKLCG